MENGDETVSLRCRWDLYAVCVGFLASGRGTDDRSFCCGCPAAWEEAIRCVRGRLLGCGLLPWFWLAALFDLVFLCFVIIIVFALSTHIWNADVHLITAVAKMLGIRK